MTKRELDKPEFLIGLRGYDRQQVDDYIDRLRAVASEAEERARSAERLDAAAADAIKRARVALVQERERAAESERRARAAQAELERKVHTTVGPRIAQILDLAVEEAKDLRARAEVEADEIRSSARSELEQTCVHARRELDGIEAKCECGRRQVAQLEAKEELLLADLRHLQSALQTVASVIGKREHATAMLPVLRRADEPRLPETDERNLMPMPAEASEQTLADDDAPESSAEASAATLA
jgi:chromosome segregation ATPase